MRSCIAASLDAEQQQQVLSQIVNPLNGKTSKLCIETFCLCLQVEVMSVLLWSIKVYQRGSSSFYGQEVPIGFICYFIDS